MRGLTLKQKIVLERLREMSFPARRPKDLMPLRSWHEAGEDDDWPPGNGRCWRCEQTVPHRPVMNEHDWSESAIRQALEALVKRGLVVRLICRPARYIAKERKP